MLRRRAGDRRGRHSSFSSHRIQLSVCPARSRLIAKVVGSLAVGRADVLVVAAFVARVEAADWRLGTKRQSWRRAEPIIIEFGSSPARWRNCTKPGAGKARGFGEEPTIAKAAE